MHGSFSFDVVLRPGQHDPSWLTEPLGRCQLAVSSIAVEDFLMRAHSLTLALLFVTASLAAATPGLAQPMGDPGTTPPPTEQPTPPPPPPDIPSPPAPESASVPQNAALEAVQEARALPLEEVILRNGVTDQVIAASLFPVNDRLVYRLKVLSAAGQLSVLFFYADTATPLEEG
jgi:hypothetical protein